jgi:hypothetical protein
MIIVGVGSIPPARRIYTGDPPPPERSTRCEHHTAASNTNYADAPSNPSSVRSKTSNEPGNSAAVA